MDECKIHVCDHHSFELHNARKEDQPEIDQRPEDEDQNGVYYLVFFHIYFRSGILNFAGDFGNPIINETTLFEGKLIYI